MQIVAGLQPREEERSDMIHNSMHGVSDISDRQRGAQNRRALQSLWNAQAVHILRECGSCWQSRTRTVYTSDWERKKHLHTESQLRCCPDKYGYYGHVRHADVSD